MYKECLTCQKLGVLCDGPNFLAMSAHDLLEWCKLRKNHLGLTNARLAEISDMPKGTVDGLFAGERIDFRFETIRPIVRALVGEDWVGRACPLPDADADFAEKIDSLEEENARLRNYVMENEEKHRQDLKDAKAEDLATIEFMRSQLIYRRKIITFLAVFLGICLFVIFAALIIDRMDSSKGFFWINQMFSHASEHSFENDYQVYLYDSTLNVR